MTGADPFGLTALADPLPIESLRAPLDATVRVPGSKSVTNRALVCAALADGISRLDGALFADDTAAMLGVLAGLGVALRSDPSAGRIEVNGSGGALGPGSDRPTIDARQSGTTARFVLPLLTVVDRPVVVTGHSQLQARPMGPTFDALRSLGAVVDDREAPGRLPATIRGGHAAGREIEVPGDTSSQFLSGLLLVAPCLPDGLSIRVTTPLVSRPYVDLTVAVMEAFGAHVDVDGSGTQIEVGPTGYRAVDYAVEPDASAASYPLAAAAICGGRVRVEGLGTDAHQGDAGFADLLAAMGADVVRDADGTEVRADGRPAGGEFDLTHLSDTAQTLAVVAPFADGPVRISGIGFIRGKETDRVHAVATELARCGIDVDEDDDGWTIRPGTAHPTTVRTYQDHRMAMSFALLGLRVPGIAIADPGCVAKTFPGYWAMLDELRARGRDA